MSSGGSGSDSSGDIDMSSDMCFLDVKELNPSEENVSGASQPLFDQPLSLKHYDGANKFALVLLALTTGSCTPEMTFLLDQMNLDEQRCETFVSAIRHNFLPVLGQLLQVGMEEGAVRRKALHNEEGEGSLSGMEKERLGSFREMAVGLFGPCAVSLKQVHDINQAARLSYGDGSMGIARRFGNMFQG